MNYCSTYKSAKKEKHLGNNSHENIFFISIRFNSVATKGTDIFNQKQPPEVFYKKRCSYKFRKIHRKTPVPESLFNKVAALRPATLLKKRLWHRYFPVNFVKSLKAGLYDEIFLS